MKNIIHIFRKDVRGLCRNFFALVIAIGLCFIPSLYAWFNIYSNEDPYANTGNIYIAVVSEDEGMKLEDGTTVNMGDQVIEQLKENKSIGWQFVDSSDEVLELLKQRERENEKPKNVILWVLAIVGAVAAVAGIAYAVYRFVTPDYLEDFEDDFDDDFDDYFEDEDEDK